MADAEAEALRENFERLRPGLAEVGDKLHQACTDALDLPHIDRIAFRVKDTKSFVKKASSVRNGVRRYGAPFRQIEDQIGGRVIVFFRSDLDPVRERLRAAFGGVEEFRHEPEDAKVFDYESDHLVFVIPPHMLPAAWRAGGEFPATFEMQVRTLFQHAWAEPQHDMGYKGSDLDRDVERKLAWIAASAWGADQALDEVWRELAP